MSPFYDRLPLYFLCRTMSLGLKAIKCTTTLEQLVYVMNSRLLQRETKFKGQIGKTNLK